MTSSEPQRATSFDVVFPISMYNLEALKRAAYSLMHRVSVNFDLKADHIHCTITPVSSGEPVSILERDFLREVNDQDLRISIEAQTEQTRTAILGLTFSRTGLQE